MCAFAANIFSQSQINARGVHQHTQTGVQSFFVGTSARYRKLRHNFLAGPFFGKKVGMQDFWLAALI